MTDAHCHVSGGDPSVRELLVGRDFVGVHPWDVEKWRSGEVEEWLRERLAADLRLGVGEIGLDRLKSRTVSPRMREVFAAQLRVALALGRPVVLHGAKCWGEVVKEIREIIELSNNRIIELANCRMSELVNWRMRQSQDAPRSVQGGGIGDAALPVYTGRGASPMRPQDVLQFPRMAESGESADSRAAGRLGPFLFHGFSRSGGLLPEIVRIDGYVSVGPAVLNDHAVNYRALVREIPLDRLLIETDRDCAPEALPDPRTGRPLVVRDVLEKTAEVRGMGAAELEAATDANAERFLGRRPGAGIMV